MLFILQYWSVKTALLPSILVHRILVFLGCCGSSLVIQDGSVREYIDLFDSLNDTSWITNEEPKHSKQLISPWYTGRGFTVWLYGLYDTTDVVDRLFLTDKSTFSAIVGTITLARHHENEHI
jgi:hypothetical protein